MYCAGCRGLSTHQSCDRPIGMLGTQFSAVLRLWSAAHRHGGNLGVNYAWFRVPEPIVLLAITLLGLEIAGCVHVLEGRIFAMRNDY